MDDSAVSFVHGFKPPGSLSTSSHCWCLRRFPQRRSSSLAYCQQNPCRSTVPVDLCAFGFPFKTRLTLFSVSVPVYLKLAQRCDNFDHVCSFSGPGVSIPEGSLIPSGSQSSMCAFIARVLVHSFHAKNSWTNKHRWLG